VGPRSAELIRHHDERLAEVVAALKQGRETVREIAAEMTWFRSWAEYGAFDIFLAMTEALSHLIVIERRGQAVRLDGSPLRWRSMKSRRL
jgi:hypothetical protein